MEERTETDIELGSKTGDRLELGRQEGGRLERGKQDRGRLVLEVRKETLKGTVAWDGFLA